MKREEKTVLQVQHLTVRYGEGCPCCQTHLEKNRCTVCGTVWAANDISVEVYPGEVLGIVGESGSGKSTLMQSLYFDIAPTSGEAYLQDYRNGKDSIWNASAAEQRHIKNCIMGMVYQNPVRGLRMEYSAASNIAEKLIAAGNRSAGHMTERARELLSAVEILTSRMGEAPKNFSGSMQQRVQISKALANNPSLLLLDEPTASLDNKSKVLVKDMLLKLKQEDTSMIGIFHDLEFMDGLCGIALNKKSLQYLGVRCCKDFLLFLFCRSSAALHAFQDKVMYLFRTNVQNNAEFLMHAVFRRMHGCHICGG